MVKKALEVRVDNLEKQMQEFYKEFAKFKLLNSLTDEEIVDKLKEKKFYGSKGYRYTFDEIAKIAGCSITKVYELSDKYNIRKKGNKYYIKLNIDPKH
jgi:hypothetical protein